MFAVGMCEFLTDEKSYTEIHGGDAKNKLMIHLVSLHYYLISGSVEKALHNFFSMIQKWTE